MLFRSAELLFLLIPTLRDISPQIDPQGIRAAVDHLQLSEAQAQTDVRFADRAVEIAKQERLRLIDLRVGFREELKNNPNCRLYYHFDHHLNPDGQRVVAQVLFDELTQTILPEVLERIPRGKVGRDSSSE